ncbi:MAG TPA: hypothetical protein VGN12_20740 [Pirellulales bacterium]|jgi:hypothetical protein
MSNEPAQVFRLGLIKCQVYLRKTKSGDRFNVTVNRLYKNGDQWQQSGYFGRDDLPLVIKVLDMAHTWMFGGDRENNGGTQQS